MLKDISIYILHLVFNSEGFFMQYISTSLFTITALSWRRGLYNSVKVWAMPCRATQDRRAVVESPDKTWSTGEGNGKPLQYSCPKNPMNSMVRQKDITPEDEPPRSECVQYATGEGWRAISDSSRKNEASGPKWKWHSVVDVSVFMGTRDQISNIRWIIEKAREFQKNIYFRFIDYVEALDCVDHNKLENS